MIRIVLTSFGSEADAETVARRLVGEKLAACATRLPGARSIYPWEGKIEEAGETLVLFKVPEAAAGAFISRLLELHPYEVPEVLWWTCDGVSPDYLRWALESCGIQARPAP